MTQMSHHVVGGSSHVLLVFICSCDCRHLMESPLPPPPTPNPSCTEQRPDGREAPQQPGLGAEHRGISCQKGVGGGYLEEPGPLQLRVPIPATAASHALLPLPRRLKRAPA